MENIYLVTYITNNKDYLLNDRAIIDLSLIFYYIFFLARVSHTFQMLSIIHHQTNSYAIY